MTATPTVATIASRAVVRLCARRGVEPGRLLQAAGIAAERLEDREARLPIDLAVGLWREARRLSGDERIALHTSEHLPFGALRTLDYLMASCSSPREALAKACRYHDLLNEAFRLELRRARRGEFHLELRHGLDPALPACDYAEYILANVRLRLRLVTGVDWAPREVHFAHPAPREVAEYQRVLAAPVRFGQGVDRLILDAASLDVPHPGADPWLRDLLEGRIRRRLRGAAQGRLERLLAGALREGLGRGESGLSAAALTLGVSPRTLQRRLAGRGSSFRRARDAQRLELALELLAEGALSTEEVAARLGFAERRSFFRAFRRWTGETPRRHVPVAAEAFAPRRVSGLARSDTDSGLLPS